MSTITTKDGTEIYYKDWGEGPVVTFSHGWPLNSDAWDSQMLFLAHADDLAQLIDRLELSNITMVGHSTGGGEVTRYIGRHGTARVAGVVLISAVPPGLVKSGLPVEEFDGIRASLLEDRGEFYRQFGVLFYGLNRPNASVSTSVTDQFWNQCMQVGLKNTFECVNALSEADFTDDLKEFKIPTLFLHGEDDQVVPLAISAKKAARLVPGAKEVYYPGAPHGITTTHQDRVNADVLEFIRSSVDAAPPRGRRTTEVGA
jgi:non-heme chloroperoxidase